LPSYIIHSGWWCDASGKHIGTQYNQSDDRIRTPKFFNVWYECVRTFANPEKIIVVDSASPLKPDISDKDVEIVSLKKNFKHGMICEGQYGGWTRAFALGAYYSYLNDADYSVFIEQDCLIVGEGIIERAIENMGEKGRISYGAESPVRIEQSFVVIRRDFLLEFLNRFLGFKQRDCELFTEVKFQRIQKMDHALSYLGLRQDSFVPLPFGFGRLRPIDFSVNHFYAQQWEPSELRELLRRTSFSSLNNLLDSTARAEQAR
jgi:hypothetical protein